MAGAEDAVLAAEPECGRDWMRLVGVETPSPRPDEGSKGAQGDAPPRTNNSAVDLIAGPFSDDVDRIWPGRRIGEYLAAPDARRHLWHACLAAESGMFRPTDRAAAEVAYARFTSWKGKHLVAHSYGVRAAGLVGTLGRLGPKARRPDVYRALVVAMAAGGLWGEGHQPSHEADG